MFISIKTGSKPVLVLFTSAFHKLIQNMQGGVSAVVSKGYRDIHTSVSHGEGRHTSSSSCTHQHIISQVFIQLMNIFPIQF